ncbi:MmpS family transport accessory protein [Streptomyces ziwulingensis]
MRHIRRIVVSGLVAGGLVLGLGACSDVAEEAAERVENEVVEEVDRQIDEEYEVTYEVTGDKADSIDFNAGGGDATDPKLETVTGPELPWSRTVKLRGIEAPTVMPMSVDVDGGSGELSCKIVYKGKTLVEKSGSGAVSMAGCVAISPIIG